MTANPAEIRTTIRAARNFLPQGFCHEASEQLSLHILAAKPVQQAKAIAAYCAIGSEANPMSALSQLNDDGVHCYLPLMMRDKTLLFGRWRPRDTLIPNSLGIPQPASADHCQADGLDVILAPLVAFDLQGNRLGTGGGYYDRTLAFLQHRKRPTQPRVVGVAFGMQRVDELPKQPWDIALDAVVTEHGWTDF